MVQSDLGAPDLAHQALPVKKEAGELPLMEVEASDGWQKVLHYDVFKRSKINKLCWRGAHRIYPVMTKAMG